MGLIGPIFTVGVAVADPLARDANARFLTLKVVVLTLCGIFFKKEKKFECLKRQEAPLQQTHRRRYSWSHLNYRDNDWSHRRPDAVGCTTGRRYTEIVRRRNLTEDNVTPITR